MEKEGRTDRELYGKMGMKCLLVLPGIHGQSTEMSISEIIDENDESNNLPFLTKSKPTYPTE